MIRTVPTYLKIRFTTFPILISSSYSISFTITSSLLYPVKSFITHIIKRFRSPAPTRITIVKKAWYKRISIQSSTDKILQETETLHYVPVFFIWKNQYKREVLCCLFDVSCNIQRRLFILFRMS
mgnify:FL=1